MVPMVDRVRLVGRIGDLINATALSGRGGDQEPTYNACGASVKEMKKFVLACVLL